METEGGAGAGAGGEGEAAGGVDGTASNPCAPGALEGYPVTLLLTCATPTQLTPAPWLRRNRKETRRALSRLAAPPPPPPARPAAMGGVRCQECVAAGPEVYGMWQEAGATTPTAPPMSVCLKWVGGACFG